MTPASSDTTAAKDPRQVIWLSMYEVYYDAYYNETVADKLISCWLWIDQVTKVGIALTASGSAIAGWSLWSQPGYAGIWVALAGLVAVLSIMHSVLSVADRLQNASEVKRCFAALKNDIQICRQRIRVNPDFPVDEFSSEQWKFMRCFSDYEQRIDNDIMRTNRLKVRAQDQINIFMEVERQSYGD